MSCSETRGAFQHADVNIGWFPFRTVRATQVRSKPGGGLVLAELRAFEGVALQSVRNPGALDRPRRRAVVRTSVWGYKRAGAVTGWIGWVDLEPDPDFASKPMCTGPARMDFEVGRGTCVRGARNGCGRVSVARPVMVVSAATAHLRYSSHGTSFWILHEGDLVRVVRANAPQGCHLVEVLAGSVARLTRGYVSVGALRRDG